MAGTGGALGRERARAGEIEKATREAPKKPTTESTTPPQVAAGGPITSIAAELRELASLRDAGILTQQEFEEQKKRLLPG
ncbi:SHOCT domain-containing protein [Mycobacterium senriense]